MEQLLLLLCQQFLKHHTAASSLVDFRTLFHKRSSNFLLHSSSFFKKYIFFVFFSTFLSCYFRSSLSWLSCIIGFNSSTPIRCLINSSSLLCSYFSSTLFPTTSCVDTIIFVQTLNPTYFNLILFIHLVQRSMGKIKIFTYIFVFY